MRFSYNKLFKLLIDRGINKKTLREMSGISATSVAKLGKGGNVNADVLLRICCLLYTSQRSILSQGVLCCLSQTHLDGKGGVGRKIFRIFP